MQAQVDINDVVDALGMQIAQQAVENAKLKARIVQLEREKEASRAAGTND